MKIKELDYLENSLYEIFTKSLEMNGFSKCRVIFEGQNGAIPKIPYLSISLRSISRHGMPYFLPKVSDDDGSQTYKQPVERSCIIYGFGHESEDILSTIQGYSENESFINLARSYNLVINNVQDIIPGLYNLDENNEYSYSFGFTVDYERIVEDMVGYIESVEINGRVFDVDGTLKYDENYLVQK